MDYQSKLKADPKKTHGKPNEPTNETNGSEVIALHSIRQRTSVGNLRSNERDELKIEIRKDERDSRYEKIEM